MSAMCATCPFRPGGWRGVRELLTERALNEATPICHSTGPRPLAKRVYKRAHACRGARDLQLALFHGLGFLDAATDEAWASAARQMGFETPPKG